MSSASAASSTRRRMKRRSRWPSRRTAAEICRSCSEITGAPLSVTFICRDRRTGGANSVPGTQKSALQGLTLVGQLPRAPLDTARDELAAGQSGRVQRGGAAGQIRQLQAALAPGTEEPLECPHVRVSLQLSMQRVHVVAFEQI